MTRKTDEIIHQLTPGDELRIQRPYGTIRVHVLAVRGASVLVGVGGAPGTTRVATRSNLTQTRAR